MWLGPRGPGPFFDRFRPFRGSRGHVVSGTRGHVATWSHGHVATWAQVSRGHVGRGGAALGKRGQSARESNGSRTGNALTPAGQNDKGTKAGVAHRLQRRLRTQLREASPESDGNAGDPEGHEPGSPTPHEGRKDKTQGPERQSDRETRRYRPKTAASGMRRDRAKRRTRKRDVRAHDRHRGHGQETVRQQEQRPRDPQRGNAHDRDRRP